MTDSSVATNVHKTFDVHLDSRTKFTLDFVLVRDERTDLSNLLVVPLAHFSVKIDSALLKDLSCGRATDTEDVGKAYLSPLLFGKSTPAILAIISLLFSYTTEYYPWRILNLGFFLQIT